MDKYGLQRNKEKNYKQMEIFTSPTKPAYLYTPKSFIRTIIKLLSKLSNNSLNTQNLKFTLISGNGMMDRFILRRHKQLPQKIITIRTM